jgi:hypothetical protein
MKYIPEKPLSVIVFSAAIVAYLCGLVIWHLSLCGSYCLLWLISRHFRKKDVDERGYRLYRFEMFSSIISKIKSVRTKGGLCVDEKLGRDVPDYRHLVLELYRCCEELEGYIADKLASSWQSCTMMLALVGTVVMGGFVAAGLLVYFMVIGKGELVLPQAGKVIGFLVVYLAIGQSLLQRNKLMVRDLAMGYLLLKEKTGPEQKPMQPTANQGR